MRNRLEDGKRKNCRFKRDPSRPLYFRMHSVRPANFGNHQVIMADIFLDSDHQCLLRREKKLLFTPDNPDHYRYIKYGGENHD